MKRTTSKKPVERKYTWYSEDNYSGEDYFYYVTTVKKTLEGHGIHPNDFENWGKYITHLGDMVVQAYKDADTTQL